MFPDLPRDDAGPDATEKLAKALIARSGQSTNNRTIPAGYTYFGQFVDHDITFDPMSKLQRDNDPDALVDFRTPRFDLDSVYGSGPAVQPYLYEADDPVFRNVKLLVGDDDLPRNSQGRALLGDARNDENVVIAQLQLLFLRFHNKVVDHLLASGPALEGAQLLDEAQRIVRWHYQWIVVHDFLPRVVGKELATVEREYFEWDDKPFIPVEFSAAAYRFGHSMVRERYKLNEATDPVPPFAPPGAPAQHLGGFRPVPPELRIEWRRFFDVTPPAPNMHSMRMDDSLAGVLLHVRPSEEALARLNLERGVALGLPAGSAVARAMGAPELTEAELALDGLDDSSREALLRAPPLWYYVLREAVVHGGDGLRLGPVGGRIVAEVLNGLLDGDPSSYRGESPPWKPELPRAREDDFTMGDLVRFTLGL
jgi:Animal haem peroxidase